MRALLAELVELACKAVRHKYIRRYKKNGRWNYVYPTEGHRHGEHQVARHRLAGEDEHVEG